MKNNEHKLEEQQTMGAIERLGYDCQKQDGLFITTDDKGENFPMTTTIDGLKTLLSSLRKIKLSEGKYE